MRVSPRLDPMGRIVLACLVVLSLAGGFARAERLPVRTYTMEDGLPSDEIRKIVRDSHGYLWFLTDRGLCRFDGHVFTTFGPEFGLPVTRFTDFLETMDGTLLAGTFDGLYWYDPADPKCRDGFRHARPFESGFGNQIQSLIEDHDGHVLCGTGTGTVSSNVGNIGYTYDTASTATSDRNERRRDGRSTRSTSVNPRTISSATAPSTFSWTGTARCGSRPRRAWSGSASTEPARS